MFTEQLYIPGPVVSMGNILLNNINVILSSSHLQSNLVGDTDNKQLLDKYLITMRFGCQLKNKKCNMRAVRSGLFGVY